MFEKFTKNVNKVAAAGVIATAGISGMPQTAEAGGYTPPSQEEMSQIKSNLTRIELEYKKIYGGDITLSDGGGKINIIDNKAQKILGVIQTRNIFSRKSELDVVKSIPTFEIEKERIVSNLSDSFSDPEERRKLKFEIRNPKNGMLTSFEISKYGLATMKVSGAILDSRNGQLYSPDGISRVDFTDGGNNIEVEVKGNTNEMAITVCTKEKANGGGLLTKAFDVKLVGDYRFSELPISEISKTCR